MKKFKDGDIVLYRGRTYLFDRYYPPNGEIASIFLLEDDNVNLFESEGQLAGYEVQASELERYNG